MMSGVVALAFCAVVGVVWLLVMERRRRREKREQLERHAREIEAARLAWLREERAAAIRRIERTPDANYRAYLYGRFVAAVIAGDYG